MTVASTDAKAGPYTGNNIATTFAFAFKVFADADIRVVETLISTGVETNLVLNGANGYTVTRNNDQDNNPGGFITYRQANATAALPSTKKLTIVGDFEFEQPTDLPNGGPFFARVVENALDRVTLLVKQLKELLGRSLSFPVSDPPGANTTLPPASQRADKLLSFDANGNPIAVAFSAQSAAALQMALAGANGVLMVGNAADKRDLASTTSGLGASLIGRGVTMVDSVAALRLLLKTSASRYAETAGYYVPGGGGEASYYLDAADTTSSDNGFTVIVAADGGRWKLSRVSDWNVRMAGAKGDNTGNDAPFINAAIAACIAANRRKLKIPAGIYAMGGNLSIALTGINAIELEGDGSQVTELRYAAGVTGLVASFAAGNWWLEISPSNGLTIRGITFSTASLNTNYGCDISGGSVTGRPPRRVQFTDVEWRAVSGFSQMWNTVIRLTDTADVWFNHCRWVLGGPGNASATGINIIGSVGTDPSAYYFSHCEALYGARWIAAGSNVEGIYLTQCSHVAGSRAVEWVAGAESGFHVIGGHYNNNGGGNFYLEGIFDYEVVGALLYSEGHTTGGFNYIHSKNGGRGAIVGNVFNVGGTGAEYGVFIENSAGGIAYGTNISGNTFNGLTGAGVQLQPTAQYVTVGPNSYNNCLVKVGYSANSNNFVFKRDFAFHHTQNLTGGAVSEAMDLALPAGLFTLKPNAVFLSGSAANVVGFYDFNHANSTASNARINIRTVDGTNLPAGAMQFSVVIFE